MSEIISSDTPSSEEELLQRAQSAINQCNWVVGECASIWTTRYAKGRTDADFATLLSISADQVYQRRRVWETFSDVRHDFPMLKWSHFYVALNWDDALENLRWAADRKATVAEMRACRKSVRGDGPETEAPSAPADGDLLALVSIESAEVQEPVVPGGLTLEPWSLDPLAGQPGEADATYTPFRRDAAEPGIDDETEGPHLEATPDASPHQILRRMTRTLERYHEALTPELVKELRQLPKVLRSRFVQAAGALHSRARRLE